MIEPANGNLLEAKAEALVNAVNTVGVMGAGIALQFRQRFPDMFSAYVSACRSGGVLPGRMHVFELGQSVAGPRWIINFPTKRHWRERSRLEDIIDGLGDLVMQVQRLEIRSLAVPPLGCGLGGLEWGHVRPQIECAFESVRDVRVLLFEPANPSNEK